jgi:hypothetical protein
MLDETLLQRLYGDRPGWHPWRVFKTGPKMLHVPGLKGYPDAPPDNWPVHGYRGIMVKRYDAPPANVLLCWASIDVDQEDNPGVDLRKQVVNLLRETCIIRTSKSGLGVHVLLPLAEPLEVPYSSAASLAKSIIQPQARLLESGGITRCVSGLPNMWLWSEGGLQRTLCDDGYALPWFDCKTARLAEQKPASNLQDSPRQLLDFTGAAGAVADRLTTCGIVALRNGFLPRKQNVNIGAVKRALGGLIELKTRSKCRPEHTHEINGFVEFTPDCGVKIFSNPDQCVILALESL